MDPKITENVIEEAWAARDTFSSTASEAARRLAFLGYGLIALFGGLNKAEFKWPISIPPHLVIAGLLLTIGLAADFLQYIYGAAAYAIFARLQERKDISLRAAGLPAKLNIPILVLWIIKIVLVSTAWIILIIHLATHTKA